MRRREDVVATGFRPAGSPSGALTRVSPPVHVGGLTLRANFAWTFLANVVYAASQWGILVVIARYCGPAEVGQFALALALSAPLMLLLNLQLRSYQVTDARGEYTDERYVQLRFATSSLALLILSVIAAVAYSGTLTLVIVGVAAFKAVESVSDIFHGVLHRRERLDRVGRSMIVRGVGSLGLVAVVLAMGGSLLQAVLAKVVWSGLMMIYDYWMIAQAVTLEAMREGREEWAQVLVRLAWRSAPLGLAMFLISINANIPQYILEALKGEYALGVYSVMASFIVVGSTVIQAMGQSATPRLSRHVEDNNRDAFRSLLRKMVAGALVVGLLGVGAGHLLGEFVLALVYGPEFARHADVLVFVMVAGLAAYVAAILRQAFIVMRLLRAQVLILALSNALLLPLAYVLVSRYGAVGAAAALAGALGVQVALFITVYALNEKSAFHAANTEVYQ